MSFQRSEVAIQHIVDGTSKTYLIGEKFMNPILYETGTDGGDNETWCTGYNNDNYRSTYMPPAQDSFNETFAPIYPGDSNFHYGNEIFGSVHPGGFNIAFCDGHVETIAYDVGVKIHRANGNRRDN